MRRDAKEQEPRKASRSLSTYNLKDHDNQEVPSESDNVPLRSRRSKSVFDLRKDGKQDDDEGEGSKLKAFINFFRNLRPNKEKEEDKVISLIHPRDTEETESQRKAKGHQKSRGRRRSSVKQENEDQNEEEEEKDEKKQRKKRTAEAKIKKGKTPPKPRDRKDSHTDDDDDDGDGDSDNDNDNDDTPRTEKSTLPRRNGSAMYDQCDSLSDLSLDSLQLPPEYSNRDLEHRVVRPDRSKQQEKSKSSKAGRRKKEAADQVEDVDFASHSKPKAKDRHAASGSLFVDPDTRSNASERTDKSDDSADSSQSNFSKLRRRFRSRKSSTIEEVEEGSDHENRKGRRKGRQPHGDGTPRSRGGDEEKKRKGKKKGRRKASEGFEEDDEDEDEDPEVIVEQIQPKSASRRTSRSELDDRQSQAVHITYLSSDTEDEEVVRVDRRKQNFVEERKGFRFLRRTPREKKGSSNSATRITPLTEGDDAHYSLGLPLLPTEPWDAVEYDAERQGERLDEDDFISAEQLQNLLGDPSEKGAVAVVDARPYTDFLQSRVVFAKHASEFQDAEAEMLGDVCSTFSSFVLYDENGRTLSLMDSALSRVYDFLKSAGSWRVFIVDGGHDALARSAPFLLSTSKKTTRYDLTPSSCEKGYLLWGNSQDMSLSQVAKIYSVSHVVTFESDLEAKVPPGVESLFVKVDADSARLFDHFEALLKFMLLGKRDEQRPSRVLVLCNAADNRASAVVVAFMMFKHHWSLKDAFSHVSVRRRSMEIGKNNVKALQKLEKRLFGKQLSRSALKIPALKEVPAKKEEEAAGEPAVEDGSDAQSAREQKGRKKKKAKKAKKEQEEEEEAAEDDNNNERKPAKKTRPRSSARDDVASSNASSLNLSNRRSDDERQEADQPPRRSRWRREKRNGDAVTAFSIDDSASGEEEPAKPQPKPRKRGGLFRRRRSQPQAEEEED